MSPGRDDIGDCLESQRIDNDESKRLKRLFFETYVGDSRKHMSDENGKPSQVELKQLGRTIFDRADSPADQIRCNG
jgi:hypothetical protein